MASTVNSRLTHTLSIVEAAYRAVPSRPCASGRGSRPGSPNSTGSTAVQPIAATRSANSSTFGVMPGTSAITITAGPVPRRRIPREVPSCVNEPRSYPDRSWSVMTSHPLRTPDGPGELGGPGGVSHA